VSLPLPILRSRPKQICWTSAVPAPMLQACIRSNIGTYQSPHWRQSARPNAAWPPRCPSVLVTTCLGVFLAQLDTSVVNLALKHIGAELGSSITQLQWVVDGYNLAYAAFLLTGGTLGDIFGRRRLFMIGVALFTAGSLICGIALDNATMIVGRTLTGLGAAFEMPTSLAILSDAYPDAAQRARAIGVWASCNGLAWVVGPTMGGTLLDC